MLLCAVLAAPLLAVCSQVHDEDAGGDRPVDADSGVSDEVLEAVGADGTVLLFRHALTDRSASDADPTARGGCDQQRNLSAEGVQQAALVGQRLDALGVEVQDVFASPFCRTVDTAEAMTGEVTTTDAFLSLTAALDAAGADAITEAGRALIAEQLESADVTVVVTHTQNIEALAGVTVGEGDAAVVDAGGLVGVIHADEW